MSFIHKVIAIEQLAYDATLVGLRHHFGDRNVRWVHWTLSDRESGEYFGGCEPPIVKVLYYQFSGVVEVPHLKTTLLAHLECAMREMEDGSREICSVQCISSFHDEECFPLEMPQGYMSYYFGEKHPRGRPKDVFPKFLPTRLFLLPRQKPRRNPEVVLELTAR